MKNSYIVIIALVAMSFCYKAWGECVTRKVHFSHSELKLDSIIGEDGERYIRIAYPSTYTEDKIGYPELPIRYITIPLPFTADNISIDYHVSNKKPFTLNRKIYPVQEPEITCFREVNKRFYSYNTRYNQTDTTYPTKQARLTEISCIGHENRNVVIAIYPLVYHSTENYYDFIEDIEITLSYINSPQRAKLLAREPQVLDVGIPFYEYCVITNHNLKGAFTRFIAWKREKGLNAGIVCKEDILNNTNIIGDTVSSIYDDAGKIRQYLQYAYASGITKYVLFGGNDQILPIRYGTGDNNYWTYSETNDYKIPSDLYFSELNSNWNTDNDQYYGEKNDTLDSGSELAVGRLLCVSLEEIHNYTDKLLRYELNPGNGDFSYLKKALYTHDDQMQKWHEQDSIAAHIRHIFPIDTIFSEYPSYSAMNPTSPYGNDVIQEMNNNYGYVSWGGHGHPNAISVKSNGVENGPVYAITSVQGNIPYITQESANGLNNLSNKDYPMFAYSISCTITPFDTYNQYTEFPNIGQSFILGKNYGGIALVGNTRNGYIISSMGLQMKFNECLNNNPIIGYAQNYAKMHFYNHFLRHSSNLIGCPNIRLWTDIPTRFNATLSYNYDNYVIEANNSITEAEIGIRDITQSNEIVNAVNFNPSLGAKTLTNVRNSLITLTGKNCLPQIMPLTIQDVTLQGTHHVITKDVACGNDVRNGMQGEVVFENGSDYTFETKGTFVLGKGVTIKQGAQLKVIPSEINF